MNSYDRNFFDKIDNAKNGFKLKPFSAMYRNQFARQARVQWVITTFYVRKKRSFPWKIRSRIKMQHKDIQKYRFKRIKPGLVFMKRAANIFDSIRRFSNKFRYKKNITYPYRIVQTNATYNPLKVIQDKFSRSAATGFRQMMSTTNLFEYLLPAAVKKLANPLLKVLARSELGYKPKRFLRIHLRKFARSISGFKTRRPAPRHKKINMTYRQNFVAKRMKRLGYRSKKRRLLGKMKLINNHQGSHHPFYKYTRYYHYRKTIQQATRLVFGDYRYNNPFFRRTRIDLRDLGYKFRHMYYLANYIKILNNTRQENTALLRNRIVSQMKAKRRKEKEVLESARRKKHRESFKEGYFGDYSELGELKDEDINYTEPLATAKYMRKMIVTIEHKRFKVARRMERRDKRNEIIEAQKLALNTKKKSKRLPKVNRQTAFSNCWITFFHRYYLKRIASTGSRRLKKYSTKFKNYWIYLQQQYEFSFYYWFSYYAFRSAYKKLGKSKSLFVNALETVLIVSVPYLKMVAFLHLIKTYSKSFKQVLYRLYKFKPRNLLLFLRLTNYKRYLPKKSTKKIINLSSSKQRRNLLNLNERALEEGYYYDEGKTYLAKKKALNDAKLTEENALKEAKLAKKNALKEAKLQKIRKLAVYVNKRFFQLRNRFGRSAKMMDSKTVHILNKILELNKPRLYKLRKALNYLSRLHQSVTRGTASLITRKCNKPFHYLRANGLLHSRVIKFSASEQLLEGQKLVYIIQGKKRLKEALSKPGDLSKYSALIKDPALIKDTTLINLPAVIPKIFQNLSEPKLIIQVNTLKEQKELNIFFAKQIKNAIKLAEKKGQPIKNINLFVKKVLDKLNILGRRGESQKALENYYEERIKILNKNLSENSINVYSDLKNQIIYYSESKEKIEYFKEKSTRLPIKIEVLLNRGRLLNMEQLAYIKTQMPLKLSKAYSNLIEKSYSFLLIEEQKKLDRYVANIRNTQKNNVEREKLRISSKIESIESSVRGGKDEFTLKDVYNQKGGVELKITPGVYKFWHDRILISNLEYELKLVNNFYSKIYIPHGVCSDLRLGKLNFFKYCVDGLEQVIHLNKNNTTCERSKINLSRIPLEYRNHKNFSKLSLAFFFNTLYFLKKIFLKNIKCGKEIVLDNILDKNEKIKEEKKTLMKKHQLEEKEKKTRLLEEAKKRFRELSESDNLPIIPYNYYDTQTFIIQFRKKAMNNSKENKTIVKEKHKICMKQLYLEKHKISVEQNFKGKGPFGLARRLINLVETSRFEDLAVFNNFEKYEMDSKIHFNNFKKHEELTYKHLRHVERLNEHYRTPAGYVRYGKINGVEHFIGYKSISRYQSMILYKSLILFRYLSPYRDLTPYKHLTPYKSMIWYRGVNAYFCFNPYKSLSTDKILSPYEKYEDFVELEKNYNKVKRETIKSMKKMKKYYHDLDKGRGLEIVKQRFERLKTYIKDNEKSIRVSKRYIKLFQDKIKIKSKKQTAGLVALSKYKNNLEDYELILKARKDFKIHGFMYKKELNKRTKAKSFKGLPRSVQNKVRKKIIEELKGKTFDQLMSFFEKELQLDSRLKLTTRMRQRYFFADVFFQNLKFDFKNLNFSTDEDFCSNILREETLSKENFASEAEKLTKITLGRRKIQELLNPAKKLLLKAKSSQKKIYLDMRQLINLLLNESIYLLKKKTFLSRLKVRLKEQAYLLRKPGDLNEKKEKKEILSIFGKIRSIKKKIIRKRLVIYENNQFIEKYTKEFYNKELNKDIFGNPKRVTEEKEDEQKEKEKEEEKEKKRLKEIQNASFKELARMALLSMRSASEEKGIDLKEKRKSKEEEEEEKEYLRKKFYEGFSNFLRFEFDEICIEKHISPEIERKRQLESILVSKERLKTKSIKRKKKKK